MLNPNCSEMVVRINLANINSVKAKNEIMSFYENIKEYYEHESETDEWYKYLLNYIKEYGNLNGDKTVIYCSRFEGEDEFILDLKEVDYLYGKGELLDAQEKGIILSCNIKGKR